MKHVFTALALLSASLFLTQQSQARTISPGDFTCDGMKEIVQSYGYADVMVGAKTYRVIAEPMSSETVNACKIAGGKWQVMKVVDAEGTTCKLRLVCPQAPNIDISARRSSASTHERAVNHRDDNDNEQYGLNQYHTRELLNRDPRRLSNNDRIERAHLESVLRDNRSNRSYEQRAEQQRIRDALASGPKNNNRDHSKKAKQSERRNDARTGTRQGRQDRDRGGHDNLNTKKNHGGNESRNNSPRGNNKSNDRAGRSHDRGSSPAARGNKGGGSHSAKSNGGNHSAKSNGGGNRGGGGNHGAKSSGGGNRGGGGNHGAKSSGGGNRGGGGNHGGGGSRSGGGGGGRNK